MGKHSRRGKRFQESDRINPDICSVCNIPMIESPMEEAQGIIAGAKMMWRGEHPEVDTMPIQAYKCPNCGISHVNAKFDEKNGLLMRWGPPTKPAPES